MNSHLIEVILHKGKFPHPFTKRKLVETHISYVILGTYYAYKFKKEIKYSFLDFSTLPIRKYYCEREVMLNNRLSKGVYLDVVTVRKTGDVVIVDGNEGEIIDYAVKMKRLRDDKQMHVMLKQNEVTKKHIKALASVISKFHQHAEVIHRHFNIDHFSTRFNDILSVSEFLKGSIGEQQVKKIENTIRVSDEFLKKHSASFEKRVAKGFVRDCHGDLHSRNIFLYAPPIIFDCLEFNDEFRQIDVLDEIAFFCMDLEAEGFYDLSSAFLDDYFGKDKSQFGKAEHLLFTYYKCYRANVRAKVNALRAMKPDEPLREKYLEDVRRYLSLMEGYAVGLA